MLLPVSTANPLTLKVSPRTNVGMAGIHIRNWRDTHVLRAEENRTKHDLRWRVGIFLGTADRSIEAYIGTRSGNVVKSQGLSRLVSKTANGMQTLYFDSLAPLCSCVLATWATRTPCGLSPRLTLMLKHPTPVLTARTLRLLKASHCHRPLAHEGPGPDTHHAAGSCEVWFHQRCSSLCGRRGWQTSHEGEPFRGMPIEKLLRLGVSQGSAVGIGQTRASA